MKEIICPNCQKQFSIDDGQYNTLLDQIKNKEFEEEVKRRVEMMQKQAKLQQEKDRLVADQTHVNKLKDKDQELADKIKEIAVLQQQLENANKGKALEINNAVAEKDRKIQELNGLLAQRDTDKKVALLEEQQKAQLVLNAEQQRAQQELFAERQRTQQAIQNSQNEIIDLKNKISSAEQQAQININAINERHIQEVKVLQEQVDYYKDLKVKMSTKMVGESLEQHCSDQYEQFLRMHFPNAEFGKDNDASGGSKGDFIFRDKDNDMEYISIMFEMKNEMEGTTTKHKNEDFLDKLDKDRREKKCEYAVLVSLLEPDSELYNSGIVNKSHRYEKMYVIRPQFFVPIIQLLVETSKKAIDYKRQLNIAKRQTIDITNFENELNDFKDKFGRNFRLAKDKFDKAIDEIDKTITHLQKVREALVGSGDQLRIANNKAEELTIKKLTKKNPTMKQMFNDLKKGNVDIDASDDDL